MADTYTPREMLEKLVGFDTVSQRSNLELISFVEDYLTSHGVESTRVYNEAGDKANLYAHIGPMDPGGVILSGHTDVVPVEGQNWSTDPFALTEKDGKLFGRGSCDMKGFLAIALAYVPQMLAAGLKTPIQLALSYDEEVGCEGVIPMVKELAGKMPKADICIVGEPSLMKVVTGHKGGIGFETEVTGYEVHSSLAHKGVSAIMTAATLVEWHNHKNADAVASQDPDCIFEPPFSTYHVGIINGGTAGNITAKTCRFINDFRLLPGVDVSQAANEYRAYAANLEAKIKAVRPEAGIRITRQYDMPGLAPEKNGKAEALARRLTGDNSSNVVSYGTEAGHFQAEGISTIICGPGSIEQAHQADEYISIDQLDQAARFMRDLINALS
ncbi:acetylornithine deacetylase [Neptunicoccus cionae]|uniref:Acetylornithine deacetylase n=1 Tax=Neptunicoccus cionae TaxID=2035344 RepID=A0A916QQ37_9RHOB|nr:acetylornithine deacetylase [Amylibacter cionae]GGA06859.1 acetylornithine deacetylase [Amylibacter cionae]